MSHITVRVYGVLIDPIHGLLVSDEFIRGDFFTKLPGGGLEFGEGTRDCLVREFQEETGMDINNIQIEAGRRPFTAWFISSIIEKFCRN